MITPVFVSRALSDQIFAHAGALYHLQYNAARGKEYIKQGPQACMAKKLATAHIMAIHMTILAIATILYVAM